MKSCAILLADGFEEIETIVPYDLLCRAGVKTDLVSVDNEKLVKGANSLVIESTVQLSDYDFSKADALIIPGGPGYAILEKNEQVLALIREFGENKDKILGAICAGASIPGKLGLYAGKKYTCVPDLNGDFHGTYEKKHAVSDGNLVTGISVGGAFEFAFDLIEKLEGKKKADELKKATCYKL